MTLEQKLQRAWSLARHAREDLVKAQENLKNAQRAWVEATDHALAVALIIAGNQEIES